MNLFFLSMGHLANIKDQGIYTDLLREFRDNGHNIYVMTPLERRKQKETYIEKIDGVTFIRVRTLNLKDVNIIEKGIGLITLEPVFSNAVKKYLSNIKFDLVLYSTPPITFTNVVKLLKKRDNAKTYLLLKDIFPQNAIDLKLFTKINPVYHYFRMKEKQLYKISDVIGCMSEGNIEYIKKNNTYLDIARIELAPNTITPQTTTQSNNDSEVVRKKYLLPMNKTIFLYGGNLGKPQDIDFIIKSIQRNELNKNSFILVVGSGTEFGKLSDFFTKSSPKNAMLMKYLPVQEFNKLLSACDVGLIFLDYRFTIPNIPSRLLSYLQASLPVLAATDSTTDLKRIIEENQIGIHTYSDDVESFNKGIIELTDQNLRIKYGTNAKALLEKSYTTKNLYQIIMKQMKRG